MVRRRYKTARCVLRNPGGTVAADQYLLVEHNSWNGKRRNRWGLPGGRIEWREHPMETARRELQEELGIDEHYDLIEIGDFTYKGHWHQIYGANFAGVLGDIDENEIVQARWFSFEEVEHFARIDRLHAGFEFDAVAQFYNSILKE